ncbi:uncharacterized protein LOC131028005 [Cryptomeria japonica]|uniref:uncharacterized protein LOC131028005 n=1 Tax=Cryptomeria japonica TaxID=3369 RepID=UPI0025AD1ABC|nr:uncharacterized protein LOC131028005 [Cryptomeria japonica]
MKKTKWEAPSPSWHKLNFDGAIHNTWQAGGGVIKDHQGKLIATYIGSLRDHTVNQAEGMKFSISIGIRQLEIEGDSKLIMEAVSGRSVAGWKVEVILRDVRILLAKIYSFTLPHIHREGNVVADSMDAFGMLQDGFRCWRNVHLLPMVTKEILERERLSANNV